MRPRRWKMEATKSVNECDSNVDILGVSVHWLMTGFMHECLHRRLNSNKMHSSSLRRTILAMCTRDGVAWVHGPRQDEGPSRCFQGCSGHLHFLHFLSSFFLTSLWSLREDGTCHLVCFWSGVHSLDALAGWFATDFLQCFDHTKKLSE